jgi:hypothetical protein
MMTSRTNVPKFLSRCPPATLRKYPEEYSFKALDKDIVESVEDVGQEQVYDLSTDCKSFIVEGFIVHNCQWCSFLEPCIALREGREDLSQQLLESEFAVQVREKTEDIDLYARIDVDGLEQEVIDYEE